MRRNLQLNDSVCLFSGKLSCCSCLLTTVVAQIEKLVCYMHVIVFVGK